MTKSWPLLDGGAKIKHTLVILAVALSVSGANVYGRDQGYILSSAIWQTHIIPVCWENPNQDNLFARQIVEYAVRETWESHSGLLFSGWGACNATSRGIRIFWSDEGPHTVGLGTILNGTPHGMVLNHTFRNWSPVCSSTSAMLKNCIYAIAVHEFGHALGFAHEQNRPDTPVECREEPQGNNGDTLVGPWDQNSIMNYCNPDWNGNGRLSAGDITTVQRFYGLHFRDAEWLDAEWNVTLDDPKKRGGAETQRAFGTLANDGGSTNLTEQRALLRANASVVDESGHNSDATQTVSASRRFRLPGFNLQMVHLYGILRGALDSDSSTQGSKPSANVDVSAEIISNGVEVLKIALNKSVSNGNDAYFIELGDALAEADVKILPPGDYQVVVTLRTQAFVPGQLIPFTETRAKGSFFDQGIQTGFGEMNLGWDVGISAVEYAVFVNNLVNFVREPQSYETIQSPFSGFFPGCGGLFNLGIGFVAKFHFTATLAPKKGSRPLSNLGSEGC